DSLDLEMSIFDPEDGNQKILKVASIEQGFSKITFKYPVQDIQISALDFSSKTRWSMMDLSSGRDTLYYWNTSGKDSLRLRIQDKFYQFDDTVKVGTGKDKKPNALKLLTNVSGSYALDIGKDLEIWTSRPHIIQDPNRIKLYRKVDSTEYSLVKYDLNVDEKKVRVLSLNQAWEPGASYRLHIEKEAITDLFQGKNDSVTVDFSVREEEYYGAAIFDITFPEKDHHYIVQLLNSSSNVRREDLIKPSDLTEEGKKKIKYKHVKPGKHKLKVIYDSNNNGRWDTGDHKENRQPERISFSKDEILIRANWDLELDFNLD
ncbi:MAG: hypothetical protein JKX73_06635, partial [Flavobacteriales bacterium]|nr:hypothetical protein [Flavobacteriales bacterium]